MDGDIITEDVLAAATEDFDSVLALTRMLIAIPSRGGVDAYAPILNAVSDWLGERDLPVLPVRDDTGVAVGLACEIRGSRPGPRYVLDACLDTAGFADPTAWTHPPTDPVVEDGWLYGRGSADSKSGAAIFCHLAVRAHRVRDQLAGRLVLLFDVDEHTGGFGGARAYFTRPEVAGDVAGVLIGYPGLSEIVVGGRGVHRVHLHVYGVTSHAGSRRSTPNAIDKATELITSLRSAPLPAAVDRSFPLSPKITVTAIHGGEAFSLTPGLCTINVDIRTTPEFTDKDAGELLTRVVTDIDNAWPTTQPTVIDQLPAWPPFRLPDDAPLAVALFDAAKSLGHTVTPEVKGPSNIGNYLAGLGGIPTIAGFGVDHHGLHAIDERIRIDTIPIVHAVYHAAIRTLLGAPN
ncbi:M20 family metallopeptidase [Nocardia colli]|uniref:M20 family metallopeptidase n=1 Tax=Nocardia colli TaxID=2545717 RepID=A0A5N0DXL2_9NOCA|nr:M20/M25/M40 family metallo-hydrolase [Nocardia colli]KAA8881862.1 M20 family metallopeptidase [Nocardia colli]